MTKESLSRRLFLKRSFQIGIFTLSALGGVRKVDAQEPETVIDKTLKYFSPYPGKQEIILNEYKRYGQESPILKLLFDSQLEGLENEPPHEIRFVKSWPTDNSPNYTEGFVDTDKEYVLVACWGDMTVNKINILSDETVKLDTGQNTNPLDVVYDEARKRVVVASADEEAHIIIFDSADKKVRSVPLAGFVGQGKSIGGAQGVTVDREGNYWAALAYCGVENQGVVVKMDGDTLDPLLIIKDVGLNNPNGITTSEDGITIFAFSDNGFAQQFNTDGKLERVIETLPFGYRGTVRGDNLWVTGWLPEGKMIRYNLKTGEKTQFPCIPLGNSVKVDSAGYIWVAGDAGISVSDPEGKLLTTQPLGLPTNGLTTIDDKVFLVSYDRKLHQVKRRPAQETFLPLIFR